MNGVDGLADATLLVDRGDDDAYLQGRYLQGRNMTDGLKGL